MYYLKYDTRMAFGSAEHYYHYLWGYLLPSIYVLNQEQDKGVDFRKHTLCFRSCGPVMDKVTQEIAEILDFQIEILPLKELGELAKINILLVPRWDIELVDLRKKSAFKYYFRVMKFKKAFTLLFKPDADDDELIQKIVLVKDAVIQAISKQLHADEVKMYSNHYLLLKRSVQPLYYKPGSKCEVATYGTARRSLNGLEEACEYLAKCNIPVRVFEPGTHSISEQIKVFQQCKGIVGIIGAEFANVIWLPEHAKIIRLSNRKHCSLPTITQNLTQICKLQFTDMIIDTNNHPVLDPKMIKELLL